MRLAWLSCWEGSGPLGGDVVLVYVSMSREVMSWLSWMDSTIQEPRSQ